VVVGISFVGFFGLSRGEVADEFCG
jgi:hypothetical protein